MVGPSERPNGVIILGNGVREPTNIDDRRRNLIVIERTNARGLTPETDDDRLRVDAIEALSGEGGVYEALVHVVERMPLDRFPALDFGYDRIGGFSFGVIRWAPVNSTENIVLSKAVKVTEGAGDQTPGLFYPGPFSSAGWLDRVDWVRYSTDQEGIAGNSLVEMIRLAMQCVTVKINDDRKLVNGEFVGRPGVG